MYADLMWLTVIAMASGRADTTELDDRNHPTGSWELTPSQAAAQLGITADAIRKACRTGRLKATKPAGSREWRIGVTALAEYKTAA